MNIPGYKIVREIGRGGMARVYLAEQESLSRPVALKVISPALAADSRFSERFVREGRTIAQLRHTHIVSIYDIGVSDHQHYIAMEYVEADNLKERIKRGLSTKQVLQILKQIASALGYAHSKGFVHRDVKPENILFREDGSAVLTDFGIAKAVDSNTQLTTTGMSIGTPHYMSPEQVRGRPTDARSDLYSLGTIMYEMLVGNPPYTADEPIAVAYAHVNERIPKLPANLAPLQVILNKLMAKWPEDRYESAEEVVRVVNALLKGGRRKRRKRAKRASIRGWAKTWMRKLPAAKTRIKKIPSLRMWMQKLSLTPVMRRPKWLWVATTVLLALFILTFFLVQGRPGVVPVAGDVETAAGPGRELPSPDVTATAGAQTRPGQADRRSTSAVIPQRQDVRLQRLLDEARFYFDAGRIVEPSGDNAWQRYLAVLELESGNEMAQEGIRRIADHYLQLARDRQAQRQWNDALASIDRGLAVSPQHVELKALQRDIRQQQKAQRRGLLAKKRSRRRAKIERLFAEAEEYVNNGRLTRPAKNNALVVYRKILKLDPTNAKAQQGISQIVDRYEEHARASWHAGDLEKAAAFVKTGLQVISTHPGLLKLREEIDEGVKQRARRRQGEKDFEAAERYYYGQGAARNYERAVVLYGRAAGNGNADAMYSLGVAYGVGNGVTNDSARAVNWFKKAALQEQVEAQYHLGLAYAKGRGVGLNEKRAFEWFRKAAAQGYNRAYKKLGWMYQRGMGVEKNWRESVRWYSRASKGDYRSGLTELKQIFGSSQDVTGVKNEKIVEEWEFGDEKINK